MNILLTGGATGLGRAILGKLASDPANQVWFTYARSEEQARIAERSFPKTTAVRCDFRSPAEVHGLVEQMKTMGLHALINNAMTGPGAEHFHKLDSDRFTEQFRHNVEPVLEITQEAIRIFRGEKSGRILTILSSYVSGVPPVGLSEYVASKNYLLSMSRSWAAENARYNIVSNCISPSFMLTPMNASVDERVVEEMIARHPLKKLLTPEEVADTVDFFLHCSLHINGTNLLMNAGGNMA